MTQTQGAARDLRAPDLQPFRAKPQRLLGLFAHPDDETFCSGGTLARYTAAGATARVVSFTRGQAGQIRDANVATRRTLGAVRETELMLACARLGVQEAVCLDFQDGGLSSVNREHLVADILREIVAFRPTTIFTFGPDGGYGHPDHVALSAAVTATWEIYLARILPSEPAPSLLYAHFPRHRRRLLDRMVHWLDARQERFQGDIGFITALLHLAEEARDLGAIADHLETRWFPPGTFVIEQGEAPATLYLILSGEAAAVREHEDGAMEHLGLLAPGHFFGEIGIARSQPRNAHVIARTPLTCLLFAPAEPTRYEGRGAGARLPLEAAAGMTEDENWGEATTRIDVSAVIGTKMSALAAYRSQFAFDPELVPSGLLTELFGVEYFVRARPIGSLECELS